MFPKSTWLHAAQRPFRFIAHKLFLATKISLEAGETSAVAPAFELESSAQVPSILVGCLVKEQDWEDVFFPANKSVMSSVRSDGMMD